MLMQVNIKVFYCNLLSVLIVSWHYYCCCYCCFVCIVEWVEVLCTASSCLCNDFYDYVVVKEYH